MGKFLDKNISEQDLIREFMDITIESQTIRPNELTVKALSDYMKISESSAKWLLRKLISEKLLRVRKVLVNSHIVNAYSPYSGKWEDVINAIKHKE